MNTLSDTLNDLIMEVFQVALGEDNGYDAFDRLEKERVKELTDEYVERIKNELNVEKYLK
jgi:hypothetical protein